MTVEKEPWPDLSRLLHMPGGLRVAETAPGRVKLYPLAGDDAEFGISSSAGIGGDVRQQTGLRIMGMEVFRSNEEIDGLWQPEWRPIMPSKLNVWPAYEAELNWSGLANAARERGDSRLYLIAGSITSQCRFAAMRLLDLSNLYLQNLYALLKADRPHKAGYVLRAPFSDLLFSSIHAACFEIATLRDYLAEFVAFTQYKDTKIDSFDALFTHVNKRGGDTPLEAEIHTIYARNRLGAAILGAAQYAGASHAV